MVVATPVTKSPGVQALWAAVDGLEQCFDTFIVVIFTTVLMEFTREVRDALARVVDGRNAQRDWEGDLPHDRAAVIHEREQQWGRRSTTRSERAASVLGRHSSRGQSSSDSDSDDAVEAWVVDAQRYN
ncbi:hypothetical protein PanWU01x14_251800 [Parasponia andersonii]|uniref:Uncharacterized protein n=1 Tax=Parasponia andersonii TaxID=3476 RepID=A0A2P5BCC0_PARAD|nr:hypothetical protein PanWU01x14_251800 [Parasponia andersonii]